VGIEKSSRTKCPCGKGYDRLDGPYLKLGGAVVVAAVLAAFLPAGSFNRGRATGLVIGVFAMMIVEVILATRTRIRQGHSFYCAAWSGLRTAVF